MAWGLVGSLVSASPVGVSASVAPKLRSPSSDFAFDSVVDLYGSGFAPGTTYQVPVVFPDGNAYTVNPANFQASPGYQSVTSDASGAFAYLFQLDAMLGDYQARVYPAGWSGNLSQSPLASFSFTDGQESANLDQCADGTTLPLDPTACDTSSTNTWQNGNLNQGNSIYHEGDSIPYRMRLGGLLTGPSNVHVLIVEWDTTKSGKHAIDYITSRRGQLRVDDDLADPFRPQRHQSDHAGAGQLHL
jgi:hypothetical protein